MRSNGRFQSRRATYAVPPTPRTIRPAAVQKTTSWVEFQCASLGTLSWLKTQTPRGIVPKPAVNTLHNTQTSAKRRQRADCSVGPAAAIWSTSWSTGVPSLHRQNVGGP